MNANRIEAFIEYDGLRAFASFPARNFALYLRLLIYPSAALRKDDRLALRFTDIFTGRQSEFERELGLDLPASDEPAEVSILITSADIALAPGPVHLSVALRRGDTDLTGIERGSADFYLAREGESPRHADASFNLARLEYFWNEAAGAYASGAGAGIPSSIDPFDPASRPEFNRRFLTDMALAGELQQDGGTAIINAAEVFHALGEKDRAEFCERAIRRTVATCLDTMLLEDGRFGFMFFENGRFVEKQQNYRIAHDAWVVVFISQCALYFLKRGNVGFARDILTRLAPAIAFQKTVPMGFGMTYRGSKTRGNCKCYDGRNLAGFAFYLEACRAAGLPQDDGMLTMARQFAQEACGQLESHQGWYDADCTWDGTCHVNCGNMNILYGLLRTYALLKTLEDDYSAELARIEAGIRLGFRFLTRTNAVVTGYPIFYPHIGQWAFNNLDQICEWYLDFFGEDADVWQYRSVLLTRQPWPPRGYQGGHPDVRLSSRKNWDLVRGFHRVSRCGAMLRQSPEYEEWRENQRVANDEQKNI